MKLEITNSLAGLNATLGDYIYLAKVLPEEALAKQGSKLGFELSSRLMEVKPSKGQITAEVTANLQSGRGVRVRPTLRRKLQEKYALQNRLSDRGHRRPQSVYGKSQRTQFRRKGKLVNFQNLAVAAETSARERGVGYSAYVARVKGLAQLGAAMTGGKAASRAIVSRGRYNQLLASANLSVEIDGASLSILYGSSTTDAGSAVSTIAATAATVDAINAVTEDIGVYITRKLQEAGR